MGLRLRIIIVIVLACSVISLFLCFYFIAQIRSFELQSLKSRIDKSAYMMKFVNARPLYNVDKETLRVNMETFFDDENMKLIKILDDDIDIDIHLERGFEPGGVDIEKKFNIYYKGLKLGKMQVIYSTSLIEKKLARFRIQMLSFTFVVILILVLVLIFLINKLMQPVINLSIAAAQIAAGDLERQIDQDGAGEVGELSRNFAVMRDAIKNKINDLDLTNKNLEKEIRQKQENEEKILRQSIVISSVNNFFQRSMLAGSCTEIAQLFIPIALAVIPSKYCFVGEKNREKSEVLDCLAISDRALTDCGFGRIETGHSLEGKQTSGIIARVIDQNAPVIVNETGYHPDFMKLPEEHICLDSFMGIPLRLGSKTNGILALAGKENGYDSSDREAAQMLCLALGEALTLKHQEEEKLRLEEMMVQSEKMVSLGGLAAGMAHEINNPLAGILQNSQVIRNRLKTRLPANLAAAREVGIDFDALIRYLEKRDVFKMLESVMTSGKRAAAIVSNMLSFSRKSSSAMVAEDLARLMDQTLELAESDYSLKKKFDFKKIRIIREYDSDIPKIFCKASEIQQVIFNILSNGTQAMMSENPTLDPCFILKIFQSGQMACIQIRDNGPGMEPDRKKRIFEPFYTTKNVGEGTGLGLAISYFIITENHKGSIKADSKPGHGTCFTIKLPI